MTDDRTPVSNRTALRTPITVVVLTAMVLAMIAWYLSILPPEQRYTIEGTRPILVFTLIVGNLGFGALMIGRVLYSSEDPEEVNKRFRLAREVFLVFSGTLGTVIGFYFGSAKENATAAPPLSATVAYADGKVTATLQGGVGPFIGYLDIGKDDAEDLLLKGEDRSLIAAVPTNACPADSVAIISDSRGQRAEARLACPATPAPGDNSADAAPGAGNSASNGAGNGAAPSGQ